MKTLVLTLLLLLSLMTSLACSKSMASEASRATTRAQTITQLQKIRILNVRQHEDRMPVATDDGRPMPPRVITVVTFEADACVDAQNRDFQLTTEKKGRTVLARIESDSGSCSENARTRFEVVTNQVHTGEALVVVNPVLMDLIAATE